MKTHPWIAADTHFLLTQWARWSRQHEHDLGYPSATPFRRLLGSSVPAPGIDDAVALRVDAALSRLQQRYPERAEAVSRYYLGAGQVAQVAEQMGVYRAKAEAWVQSGLAWLDAVLHH